MNFKNISTLRCILIIINMNINNTLTLIRCKNKDTCCSRYETFYLKVLNLLTCQNNNDCSSEKSLPKEKLNGELAFMLKA